MDDALIALVLIVISLVSWIFQKGGLLDKMRGRGADAGEDATTIDGESLSEEERTRRFMEALGLPPTSEAPKPHESPARLDEPPALPAMEPRRESDATTAQPRTTSAPAHPSQRHDQEPARAEGEFSWQSSSPEFQWDHTTKTAEEMRREITEARERNTLNAEERRALERVQQRGGFDSAMDRPDAHYAFHQAPISHLRERLFSSRAALMNAILAQEILGTPRGLQSDPRPVRIHEV